MRYTDIVVDKPIVTVSFSGCSHICSDCVDVKMQDPCEGNLFNRDTLTNIVQTLDDEEFTHCIFRGGDPLYSVNRGGICDVTRTLKAIYGNDKILCVHTGYTLDEINHMNDPIIEELFSYIDVLVDNDRCHNSNDRSYYRIVHHLHYNEFLAMKEK